jgi:hypothetical protein
MITSCGSEINQNSNEENDTKTQIEQGILDMIFGGSKMCSEEEWQIIEAVDSGEYELLANYLEGGGDPCLSCSVGPNEPAGRESSSLDIHVMSCDSTEFIKYYLTFDIPDDVLSFHFSFIIARRDDELVKYMIDSGAYLDDHSFCFNESLDRIKYVLNLGYDINKQDLESGETLLMRYAWNENEELVDCKLEVLKYLIENGADITLKNHQDKTAVDIASSEKLKTYLQTQYDSVKTQK